MSLPKEALDELLDVYRQHGPLVAVALGLWMLAMGLIAAGLVWMVLAALFDFGA